MAEGAGQPASRGFARGRAERIVGLPVYRLAIVLGTDVAILGADAVFCFRL